MKSENSVAFFCGSPVIGSTSGKFMIPAGIRLGDSAQFLTFGMDIPLLMQIICTRQNREWRI